ncbi:MAG: MarR family transcriptional regulator [Mycobacteriaceae bacterium]|nr:MarR family transcriptional regulator [Mycobacteriaceae bacterium]MBV9639848.1 MarR family transcriptional regulator [Mycobacteriaceae bacterium]
MPRNLLADQVWRQLSTLVIDNKDTWRRAVVERTGLAFSRVRILRRLAVRPMTVKQIAAAAGMDAPAATVAVTDLEQRGLVLRRVNPDNRRCKLVSLTDAGRQVVGLVEAVDDPAPASLAAFSEPELMALRDLMDRLATGN